MRQETYYGGIDAHVKFCQFEILDPDGSVLMNTSINTAPHELITFAKNLPRPLHLIVESSALTEWLVRTLEPHVDRIEACDPRQNRWIACSDKSNDKIDADKLAQLCRSGLYNPVHLPTKQRQVFREMALDYHKLTREITRTKNRIRGKYRSRGIYIEGRGLYSKKGREHYLALLDSPARIDSLRSYYAILDEFIKQQGGLLQRLRAMSSNYPVISAFQALPGVAFIVAMTFFAIVDTPWRFEDKEHLWSYCRLAAHKRTSAGKTKGGGQKGGSRLLKSMLMKAAEAAVNRRRQENEFSRRFQEVLARTGDRRIAYRAVARRICSTLYGMFKNGKPYRGEIADERE
jgi:transposase